MAQGPIRATVSTTVCGFEETGEKLNIEYCHFFALVTKQSVSTGSATQDAMPPEFWNRVS